MKLAGFEMEGIDLQKEIESASRTLEMLGLTQYEARAYMALIAHGYGDAETIAQTARIPRTSGYKVLQALEEKGFAVSAYGRPKIFKPEPPSEVRARVLDRIEDTFSKLEMVREVLSERGVPQLVYTIQGKDQVLKKVAELLDQSTRRFIISTPVLSEIRTSLEKKFQNALKRGIDIVVITAPHQKVPKRVKVYRKKNLIATDIIADGRTALLASPDLNACGFTDNPALAEHLEHFLEILLEHE